MQAEIVYSPLALSDLDAIWEYLAVKCENMPAAEREVQKVLDSLDRLSSMPESGTPLDSRCIVHSDYRYVVTGHHISFYRCAENRVFVDRVLDTRSDYLRKLFGGDESAIDLYAN